MGEFYNASLKISGALPLKKLGAQNVQNLARFQTTSDLDREYLRNGTRYPKSERDVFTGDVPRGSGVQVGTILGEGRHPKIWEGKNV